MKAVNYFRTLVTGYKSIRRHTPEDSTLHWFSCSLQGWCGEHDKKNWIPEITETVRFTISIRKVLRPAISAQVLLGFTVSTSECWDGSQDSKLLLHASHVALPT